MPVFVKPELIDEIYVLCVIQITDIRCGEYGFDRKK